MRVLVCGGRDYKNWRTIWRVLDAINDRHHIHELIHGGAAGADSLAAAWAVDRRISVRPFPADWNKHGKAAGAIRNAQMLAEGKPERVIAFPGGRGTADMVRQSENAGLPVHRVPAGT